MGSRDKNFYNDAFARQGYEDDVAAVQELWLDGKREEAADRVPSSSGFKTNLLGTPEMIKERLRLYRDAGITTMQAKLKDATAGHAGPAARPGRRGRGGRVNHRHGDRRVGHS